MGWVTESVYVDVDTGEYLAFKSNKDAINNNYIIIKNERRTKINGNNGRVTITRECRHNGQRTIEW